jgi:hypothetical protein
MAESPLVVHRSLASPVPFQIIPGEEKYKPSNIDRPFSPIPVTPVVEKHFSFSPTIFFYHRLRLMQKTKIAKQSLEDTHCRFFVNLLLAQRPKKEKQIGTQDATVDDLR